MKLNRNTVMGIKDEIKINLYESKIGYAPSIQGLKIIGKLVVEIKSSVETNIVDSVITHSSYTNELKDEFINKGLFSTQYYTTTENVKDKEKISIKYRTVNFTKRIIVDIDKENPLFLDYYITDRDNLSSIEQFQYLQGFARDIISFIKNSPQKPSAIDIISKYCVRNFNGKLIEQIKDKINYDILEDKDIFF
ncbi:MAG: hypothetical protein ACRC1T_09790 [Clostridium chrysemydis]|uniref:hypothetical protein n=1 Tax=Clostridium chrysemydis TaxID=2665504 RepID=UPI003F3264ED